MMANERVYSFWTNIIIAAIGGLILYLLLDSDDNYARLGFDICASWVWLMLWDVIFRGRRRFTWQWFPEQPSKKNARK